MRATISALRAVREPGPLAELYVIPGTDLELEIKGITDRYVQYEKVTKEAATLASYTSILLDDMRSVKMLERDLVAAAWCGACVVDPAMTAYEWAKWGYDNPSALIEIRNRCLVASRMIADPNQPEAQAGVDAAKTELQNAGDVDPLASQSGSSVSTNSTDCQQSSGDPSAAQASDSTQSSTPG